MPNPFFQFKQFTIHHDRCAMKVTTDACLFGAWAASEILTSKHPVTNLLDIGAGTGLLSLMVRQKNGMAIDAIEIDAEAVSQAKENVDASSWKDDIHIINEDLLQWQPAKKWDCIISNPPFYENELKSEKSLKNLAHHDEGLQLNSLFSFVKSHLTNDGMFFLLLPAKRETELYHLLNRFKLYVEKMVFVQAYKGSANFRLLVKASTKNIETEQEHLIIKDKHNNYTASFIKLLKDYYLYL